MKGILTLFLLLPGLIWGAFTELQIDTLQQICSYFKVDSNLMLAIAEQESDYNWEAIGNSGEVGAFQVKPGTFIWLRDSIAARYELGNLEGVSVEKFKKTPVRQMEASVLFVRWLQDQYQEEESLMQLVLMRYNASSNKEAYAEEVLKIYQGL